jgi:hypothetical protein
VLRAPTAAAVPPSHPAQEKIRATKETAAAFICVGERCSLPVTATHEIAGALTAMRG